jgi:hypothetical protein
VLSVTPSSLSFDGSFPPFEFAAGRGGYYSQPIEITNTGAQPVTISSAVISGSTEFTVDRLAPAGQVACPAFPFSLPAGTSCTISATFTLTTPGSVSATLSLINDSPITPTISLSGAAAPINMRLEIPTPPNWLVSDSVYLYVNVGSSYKLSSVTADLDGNQIALHYDPRRSCGLPPCHDYLGNLSLAGRPSGPYPLTITATDTMGNVATLPVTVVHDNPPVVKVAKPTDSSIALPTIPYDATCTDDLPGCAVQLEVADHVGSCSPHEVPIRAGTGAISGSLDLSDYIGSEALLCFYAKDSAGQYTSAGVGVYVEDKTRLTLVEEVEGSILDVDAQRTLARRSATSGDSLSIYDRASGAATSIPMSLGTHVISASLTPTGTIFTADNGHLYLWHDSTLTDWQQGDSPITVAGSYAIWNLSNLLA